jgi:threonine/homoserine/homoserine lactone efflux protein
MLRKPVSPRGALGSRGWRSLSHLVWAFIPIAALLTITPGAATAMVVRSAITGGWRSGVRVIAGNEIGVIAWALLSVAGVSALIAASEAAFVALKVTGAAVLIGIGVQSLRGARAHATAETGSVAERTNQHPPRRRRPFRDGLVTSLANPKLAVFFVALFPQFVGRRDTVLSATLVMVGLIVVFDFAWYTALSLLVSRAKRALDQSRLAQWIERISGSILIALGIRVAFESR